MVLDKFGVNELMPLETPLLKVSRPIAACLRCRSAKIKCDGKLPACTSCERTGRAAECTSTNDQFARGKERSYVLTLETRIEKLQAKLEEVNRRKPSVISIPDDETAIAVSRRPSAINTTELGTATKATRRKEAFAIDDIVNHFGFLSVNATARDFYGFTTAMSYARLILWACSRDPLPELAHKPLPPRHMTTQLLQQYLSGAHQLIPVIDESSIYGSVNKVYNHDQSKTEPFDHWTVRLVLAIAYASRSEQIGDEQYNESIGHVCSALKHSEAVLHPGAISSVQGLVLLVEFALLDPHHFDAWTLTGAASRAMVDLGLHQDPPKGTAMTKKKLEARRRVFWAVYVLDRSTSMVQSRAFSFSDESAKVKEAFVKQLETSPTVKDVPKSWLQTRDQALDLVSLRRLQSEWYTDLFQSSREPWDEPYPYIWDVCGRSRKWFETISPTTSPHMRIYFELELLYSYIYVLAPSPRVPVIAPYAQTLIFEYCIRFADILFDLLGSQGATPINFNDAMRTFMSGHFFLDILKQNTDGLLNGHTPQRPEVRLSASPPPSIPDNGLTNENERPYVNTVRAINCIRKLTDCLVRFGTRFGYPSWSTLFSTAASPMMDILLRQQESFGLTVHRRTSVWHTHPSVSPDETIQYQRSPLGSVSPARSPYDAPAQAQGGFYHDSSSPQVTPPIHHQPQLWHSSPPDYSQGLHPPSMTAYAQHTVPSYTGQPNFAAPHQQFGNWAGYAEATVPSTLDEENFVPPNAHWDPNKR